MADQPFATPAELEAHTKSQIPASDPRVEASLAAVSNSIRRRCGWHIWPVKTADTVVVDGPGGTLLELPTGKLVALTSITEHDEPVDLAETIDTSHRLALVSKRGGHAWTSRYGGIKVVMDHGYEEVPDLKQVTLDIVGRALASPMGATREQAGSLSVNWSMVQPGVAGGITATPSEREIVNSYRVEW